MKARVLTTLVVTLFICMLSPSSYAMVKGIYINPETAVNTAKITSLINDAKASGINTFVVDYTVNSSRYEKNIQLIKKSGIKYVARIVIFPGGATSGQVNSTAYLQKRLAQIKQAINLGADAIQLDYIRFKPTQAPSDKNAEKITKVVAYFKENAQLGSKVPLQIDVFGISSFKPSVYIGQNNKLIANHVNAICPMVYPSHYTPYAEHARTPYETVYTSLVALKKQLVAYPDIKVYAFIEIYNFRYPKMSDTQRERYIREQFRAVTNSGANGWYVWSAGNHYGFLFSLLKQMQAENSSTASSKTLAKNSN